MVDETDRHDRRSAFRFEIAEDLVIAMGQGSGKFLYRVDALAVGDESDDVSRDTARQIDDSR